MNFQMFKLDLEKAENQRSNCQHLVDHQKAKEYHQKKNLFLIYWLSQNLCLCRSQQTVEISRDGNTRPPYLPPEKSVWKSRRNRTEHGTRDYLQIRKGVHQGCILSPCLFNLYAVYIMWNAGLDETQVGIKIARRNISNLINADNATLMA